VTGSCLNPASHKQDVAKGFSTFIDLHLILCRQLAYGYVGRRDASSVIEAFRSGFAITPVFLSHHSVQSYLLPLRVTRTPLGGPVLVPQSVDDRPSTGDDSWKYSLCQFIYVRVQIVFGSNDQPGQRPLQLPEEGK